MEGEKTENREKGNWKICRKQRKRKWIYKNEGGSKKREKREKKKVKTEVEEK